MSADQENFDKLKQLLALKRHEVPPPGYFDSLAGDVRARLRAGEHRQQDLWAEMGEEASWLQKFWASLAAKPALATACGVAACGVALGGIYLAQPAPELPMVVSKPQTSFINVADASSSTNPVSPLPKDSLFDKLQNPAAPANWAPNQ